MNHDDLPALQAALQVSATAVLESALQILSDAKASMSEVLITQEGLSDEAAQVLATLLHEAVHSVAWQRGMNDTSRQGRYHNQRFRTVAEELGPRVRRDSAYGWTQTEMPTSTARSYRGVLRELEPLLPGTSSPGPAEAGSRNARVAIRTLACPCGHRLVRDGRGALVADARMRSGCLSDPTRLAR